MDSHGFHGLTPEDKLIKPMRRLCTRNRRLKCGDALRAQATKINGFEVWSTKGNA
jgi:hypothetical protein